MKGKRREGKGRKSATRSSASVNILAPYIRSGQRDYAAVEGLPKVSCGGDGYMTLRTWDGE
jgi:hypothetical protein